MSPSRERGTGDGRVRRGLLRRWVPSGSVGERGSASIQLVILLPVMFGIMFLGLQAALLYHARTVAIAAAEQGARAAGAETGTGSEGVAAAQAFVTGAGGSDVLDQVTVTGRRTPITATVTVGGRSLSVIPGWSPHVTQTATVATERITTG